MLFAFILILLCSYVPKHHLTNKHGNNNKVDEGVLGHFPRRYPDKEWGNCQWGKWRSVDVGTDLFPIPGCRMSAVDNLTVKVDE